MALIEIREMSFGYDPSRLVLEDISFEVQAGDFVGIIGPNGAGKTTLIKILDGVLKPLKGEILLNGASLDTFDRKKLAKMIAVVSQNSKMDFPFTGFEFVLMGRHPHVEGWIFENEHDHAIVSEVMNRTNTHPYADRLITELSGGEGQQLLVARALAQEPTLVFLDEPNAHLDIRHQLDIFELMEEVNKKEGITVLAISHDLNLTAEYCKTIVMLHNGRVKAIGTPEKVLTADHIREVYNCNVLVDKNPVTGSPRITVLD